MLATLDAPARSADALPADLEAHFAPFRASIVGIDATVPTPYGDKPLVYCDWIASGRLYAPIEQRMLETLGPFVGNTHTETVACGTLMTRAYREAKRLLKAHVNAGPDDVLLVAGSGMTAVINKFQRILGLRVPDAFSARLKLDDRERPVVFVTHMEHHSNQTSWLETICDVVVVEPDETGLVDPARLDDAVRRYPGRTLIGAFTACSNVTGIEAPIHELARVMHRHGGLCFADYAASAPYVQIDMHPAATRTRTSTPSTSRPTSFSAAPARPACSSSTDTSTAAACPTSPAAAPCGGRTRGAATATSPTWRSARTAARRAFSRPSARPSRQA